MKIKPHWLTNSVWNLLGTGIPFLFAVVCMPLLLQRLGPDRYGLLILAWAVVGYFSIFDFGLSRAITQLVARAYTSSPTEGAPVVVTGLLVLGALGVLGGALLYFGAPFIQSVGRIPPALRQEVSWSVRILGIGLPFVVMSTGLRGALEGVFDFAWLNAIRAVAGIGTYLVPFLVSTVSLKLHVICAGLVLLRAVICLGYYVRCHHFFGLRAVSFSTDLRLAKSLMSYGGWITISNLVSPLMAYLDRFLVAGAISVSLAGYYSTSQEIVTKFQIIPGAILAVLFPAISRQHTSSPEIAGGTFFRGTQFVTFTLLPLATGCLLFAHEGLTVWFGPAFADSAYRVAQILTIGSFINCLAMNPFYFLQGIGRPDITAKIHVIELPIYLSGLWWLVGRLGVIGVALAWSGRMLLDWCLLFLFAARQSPALRAYVHRATIRMVVPIAVMISLTMVESLTVRIAAFLAITGSSAWMLWMEWRAGDIVLLAAEP